jgi:hypothetical protein
MSSPPAARTPLTHNELSQALEVEVYDHVGKTTKLQDLIKGKRSVLIFTRHYCECPNRHYSFMLMRQGCLNCQAYVRTISETIPPSKLPSNTQSMSLSARTNISNLSRFSPCYQQWILAADRHLYQSVFISLSCLHRPNAEASWYLEVQLGTKGGECR